MANLARDVIEARLRLLPSPPLDVGRVERLVRRLPGERRETPDCIEVREDEGVVGDRWSAARWPNKEAQVTLMRADVAALLCDGADYAILGDNLFVSLDSSAANLPAWSRLRVGGALFEVTPKPHTGCHKFSARVGADALAVTRDPVWQHLQLRGVHLRVVIGGQVSVGDVARVESRP